MKKNMVLKNNIVAIEINLFTTESSRGSLEQKINWSKKNKNTARGDFLFIYFQMMSLRLKDSWKTNFKYQFLSFELDRCKADFLSVSPKIVHKKDGYDMDFFPSGSHNGPKKQMIDKKQSIWKLRCAIEG